MCRSAFESSPLAVPPPTRSSNRPTALPRQPAHRAACVTTTLLQELRLCIEELDNPEHVPKIVDTFFRTSLTAKPDERQATFEALAYLLQEGPLTAPVVLKGYVPRPSAKREARSAQPPRKTCRVMFQLRLSWARPNFRSTEPGHQDLCGYSFLFG